MLRKAFLASVMVLCLSVVASAVPVIVAPQIDAAPGGLHEFFITVSGDPGDVFKGVNLSLEVLPDNGNLGPIITVLDLIGPGLLFNGNNTGQGGYGDTSVEVPGRMPAYSTTTDPLKADVGPTGNLARIVIDTTGIAAGSYVLSLTHPLIGPTDLPPLGGVVLQDGLITITAVPEPGSIVLGAFAAAGLGAMVIRRRRARKA